MKVFVPTPLRKFTDGQASVEVEASSVSAAMSALAQTFPEVKQHLYDSDNEIRKFLRIYVGDEDIQQLQGLDTPVQSSDRISIIPAIAGGVN